MLTKEQLTPHALSLFKRVKASVPEEIGSRLRSHRHFITHASYVSLFTFDVWDIYQTDVLPRIAFKYCLAYDGRPGATRDGFFHLWISRSRIYRNREEIVAILDRELPRVTPRGFTYHPPEIAFNIGMDFHYPKDLSTVPDMLAPHYVDLISAVHPILIPIIDRYSTRLKPGERRAAVAVRGRLPRKGVGVYNREAVREYTRSVQRFRNEAFLARYSHRCALCGGDLRETGYHIDHIVPFSKGGQSKEENLQPLCPKCNLTKSNKEIPAEPSPKPIEQIVVRCKRCNQLMRLPRNRGTLRVTCPGCSGKFTIKT
jgi:hypothetical protein